MFRIGDRVGVPGVVYNDITLYGIVISKDGNDWLVLMDGSNTMRKCKTEEMKPANVCV